METPITLAALTIIGGLTGSPHAPPDTQIAMYCSLKGEQESGMNKVCFYDCAGSGAAITVKSYELCPLSIDQ